LTQVTAPAIDARRQPSRLELRAFAGLSMASAAISIDLILPAFGRIRSDLGLAPDSAATAGLITAFFLGMAVGPIPFGLLADRFGRRWILLATCVLFVGGGLAAAIVPSLHWMLWARFVWGLGAAGLRVIAVATIRDRFVGADMAREMAFAMAVFISVPVVAPALGAGLIKIMPWRGTFVICAGFGTAIALWSLRLPETLAVERRQPLQIGQVGIAIMAMVRSRAALIYTLCSVVIFGAFSSYLATSERVVGDVFHRASWFPYVFGGTAILMGISSMTVGRTVGRVGVDRLIRWAVVSYTVAAVAMYVLSRASDGHPSFWPFLILLSLVLVGYNVLLSNLNSAAMVPVGHVAGTAAAVYATVTTAGAAVVGQRFDKAFDGTVNPFSLAFAIAGILSLGMVLLLRPSRTREVR
jgi:DHA1 family bicyclomycin/chloramphenicol resistance-like MFS transporter